MPVRIGMRTPWGVADYAKVLAEGIGLVSTPGHGGIKLDRKRNAQIPSPFRRRGGWYEEDVDAAIPMLFFFDAFKSQYPNVTLNELHQSLKNWMPDEYMAVFKVTLTAADSHVLKKRAHAALHQNDFIAVSAVGDWHEAVPKGMVGVVAFRGGIRGGNVERGYFLVPADEYRAVPFGEFVVDPTKYQEWPEGRDA